MPAHPSVARWCRRGNLDPLLDFSVGEADIFNEDPASDAQIGTLGEVRLLGAG